jgi:hypothetical protein
MHGVYIMGAADPHALRQQALEALEESTETLAIAEELQREGYPEEAIRLRDEARQKRSFSVLLMAQSNAVADIYQPDKQ